MQRHNYHLIFRRLIRANARELLFRLKEAYLFFRIKRLADRGESIGIPASIISQARNISFPEFDSDLTAEDIKYILGGGVYTLNCDKNQILDFENRWKGVFCGDVNFSKEIIDIRAVLEPARLQHLTSLITWVRQHPAEEKKEHIVNFIKTTLIQWIIDNPFLIGPHYISALECALRIPVLALFLSNFKNLSVEELRIVLSTIFQHAWWVDNRLSLYPAPGNHAIGESLGLIIAGLIFEKLPVGKKWFIKGSRLLKAEVFRQINNDGGPLEGSVHYHSFLVEFFWLAFRLLELNKNEYSVKAINRLQLADHFLSCFNTVDNFELFSDCDTGYAIAPGIFVERTPPNKKDKTVSHFPKSGYTILQFPNSWKLLLDHAPLGMPPLHGHGHADALSIILSYRGEQFLIDPGTYRYFGLESHRNFFRSTKAHNTIEIDGKDQSEQIDNFIWDKPYQCECSISSNDGRYLIQTRHTGYNRLKGQITHIRLIEIDQNKIIINDRFSGNGTHVFRMHLHIHPEARIKTYKNYCIVSKKGATVYIKTDGVNNKTEYFKGSQDPFLGWCAPEYGKLTDCHTLRITKTGKTRHTFFETIIYGNHGKGNRCASIL